MGGTCGEECFWNEAQALWNKQPFSGNEEPISRNQPHIAEVIVTVRNTFRRLATGFPRRLPPITSPSVHRHGGPAQVGLQPPLDVLTGQDVEEIGVERAVRWVERAG